eukprot:TRINITY_DN9423_c0_g1_i1.p1 TRINITY_DN9423_c0_g1~~TRINITY_DN9423_c0_g1_i1.p1  ORF type:complete len:254 (-),score=45.01 TRINITY_DN9423_c0_g1_i1:297-1058(-)
MSQQLAFKVTACENENSSFPGSNLASGSRWETDTGGEGSIDFEFDGRYFLTEIEVGNYGAAFVEVEVSNSRGDNSWEVLLPVSQMMSYSDSQVGAGNRRSWNFQSELSRPASTESWKRLRVSITQPFMPDDTIGLEYIRVYGQPQPLDGKPTAGDSQSTMALDSLSMSDMAQVSATAPTQVLTEPLPELFIPSHSKPPDDPLSSDDDLLRLHEIMLAIYEGKGVASDPGYPSDGQWRSVARSAPTKPERMDVS